MHRIKTQKRHILIGQTNKLCKPYTTKIVSSRYLLLRRFFVLSTNIIMYIIRENMDELKRFHLASLITGLKKKTRKNTHLIVVQSC